MYIKTLLFIKKVEVTLHNRHVYVLLLQAVLPDEAYMIINGGIPFLTVEEAGWGVMVEGLLSFFVVLTYIMTYVNHQTKSQFAPLAVGFAVIAATLAGYNSTCTTLKAVKVILRSQLDYLTFLSERLRSV